MPLLTDRTFLPLSNAFDAFHTRILSKTNYPIQKENSLAKNISKRQVNETPLSRCKAIPDGVLQISMEKVLRAYSVVREMG